MCGIAGFAGTGSKRQLERMAQAIRRRGPDDEGFYEAAGVGFAFRRLSIIDVAHGHQPLANADKSVWVMLNGELYGYQTLREELIGLGYQFTTSSDTEAIVHAYEAWGDDCFQRLQGMFAIAIWDAPRQRLLLVRDRFGKKPLYWTIRGHSLWFASEIKALLAADVVSRTIDLQALGLYFRTDAVPTPLSMWQGVQKLEPATALVWQQGKIERTWKYWHLTPQPSFDMPEAGLAFFRHQVDIAVKERLVADVPLGIFLSGGLDSALIAASAASQSSSQVKAYTIGFDDPTHDETAAATAVAQSLGLDHHVQRLTSGAALDMLAEASECLDEPLADPAILPQLLLSRFARQHITVALAGDGGDELFYGYQHVPIHDLAERHRWLWRRSRHLQSMLATWPASTGYFSHGFKLQRLARGLGQAERYARDLAWRGAVQVDDLRQLLRPHIVERINGTDAEDRLRARAAELSGSWTEWQRWSWAYLRTFLMDEVMVKVDRASMWFGLEARAPLLDVRVVEAAFRVPDAYKLGAWGHKRALQELMRGKIPEANLRRPKHGFGVPIAAWLRGPLLPELQRYAATGYLERQGLFCATAVKRLIDEHHRNRYDRRRELWAYLMFQRWYQRWFER